MKKLILGIIALVLLAIAGLCAYMVFRNRDEFTGNFVRNPDEYLLDIIYMNGTDAHTMDLQEGDVLKVEFETTDGSLHMEMTAPDGTSIYSGNGTESTDFTLNIPQSGVYTIEVQAKQAKGTLHIRADKHERE